MKPLHLVFLFCLLITFFSCEGGNSEKRTVTLSDEKYTDTAAMLIYGTDPQRALVILDSAVIVGNVDPFSAEIARAQIYSKTLEGQRQDTVIQICENLLQHDSATVSTRQTIVNRLAVLRLLCNAYRTKCDNEQWLRYSIEMVELNRQISEETEALRTEAEIANVMINIGDTEVGLSKLKSTIKQLNKPGSVERLDACVVAMKRMINIYKTLGQTSDIIPLAHSIINKLDDLEQHPRNYKEDSFRLPPNPEDRARYLKFYRAQSYIFLAEAFATSQPDSAKYYLTLFDQTDYAKTFSGQCMSAPTRLELGYYKQALEIYDKMEENMLKNHDTINIDYAVILFGRAKAAQANGQQKQAYDYMLRYSLLQNQLHNNLVNSKAHEYSARYHAKEQELKIQQQKNDAKHMQNIIIVSIILLIIVACISVYYWLQRKLIAEKNKGLVEQINEAIKYKERYEELKGSINISTKNESVNTEIELKGLSEKELFEFLREEIVSKQLYLDPNFDRQTIVDRYHLTIVQVGSAFAQGSDYNSVSDFIRECRLEHACTLLKNTNMKITEVAKASGFSLLTTFNHNFRDRYKLTPTEFRR